MIRRLIKSYSERVFEDWKKDVDNKVLNLHEHNKKSLILDLGCGDGLLTIKFSQKIGSKRIKGVEGIPELALEAKKKGIDCKTFDLEKRLPFNDNSFDVIISHFSLEHLLNIDLFITEIHRLLKPRGYAVIATDNLSSWPNIGALILGLHPFSLTPGLSDIVLGNPFAIRHQESGVSWAKQKYLSPDSTDFAGTYGHIRVLAYQALKDILNHKKFIIEKFTGAGYLFFGWKIASIMSSIDPVHAHFLAVKVRKQI